MTVIPSRQGAVCGLLLLLFFFFLILPALEESEVSEPTKMETQKQGGRPDREIGV